MQTHHQGHREVRYESVSRCCTYRACYLATRRSLAHHVGSILRFTLELHFLQLALEELERAALLDPRRATQPLAKRLAHAIADGQRVRPPRRPLPRPWARQRGALAQRPRGKVLLEAQVRRLQAHDRRAHRRRVHIAHTTERLVKELLLGVGPWPLRERSEIPKTAPDMRAERMV